MTIRILSSREPYIRAGHHHPRRADYPDGHFTEEELAIFRADPVLTVVRLPDDPEGAGQRGAGSLAERLEAEIARMLGNDPDQVNDSWWTKGKKPEVAVLSELLGEPVSAAARDAAWQAVQERAE